MTDALTGIRHRELYALHKFWRAQCPPEGLPLGTDMEPAGLKRWLQNLLIMHVDGGKRFTYSYYGRSLAQAFGESRIGQTLDDLPVGVREILLEEYDQVCRQRKPLRRVYTATFGGQVQTWERMVFPLTQDGHGIDKLLVAAYQL